MIRRLQRRTGRVTSAKRLRLHQHSHPIWGKDARMIQRRGSLARRGVAALASAIVALIAASAASAWEGYWGQGQYVGPGSYLGSAYNSGLNLSEAYYSPLGNDVMGVTLCTTGGS